jgi:hypothetical protein
MDHTVNLFENFRNDVFEYRLRNSDFVKKHLEIYPTNLFELKNQSGCTIFQQYYYDEDFLKWCLEQWPTNLFEVKDEKGDTIFHIWKYNKAFKGEL